MKPRPLLLSFCFLLAVWPVLAAERLVLVAGGGTDTNTAQAIAPASARLSNPFGVDFDREGNLYLVEMTANRLRRLDRSGQLRVLAGTGAKGSTGDDAPAARATFNGPHNLAVTPGGEVFLADTWNNRVRKLEPGSGVVRAVAGTGEAGFSGDDGPARMASFGGIYCVSLTPAGDELLLADLDNRRIRAVSLKTGLVRTVAGNGSKGVPEDGSRAVAAPLVDPRAVIGDRDGRVYVLERSGNALRVVERDGRIRTVVGASGRSGLSGDGGDGRAATLNGPKHLCLDRDGGVIIADTENHVIRKYSPGDGRIQRIAGTGQKGDHGLGGAPLAAELNQPHGVTLHANGDLYICDSSNHRVLRIDRH